MSIPPPLEPGSWLAFLLHFGPWAISIIAFVIFAVIMLVGSIKAEEERRALRAWHLGRLEAWHERRQMLTPAAAREIEAFTRQIEVVVVPAPIHSDPPKEADRA